MILYIKHVQPLNYRRLYKTSRWTQKSTTVNFQSCWIVYTPTKVNWKTKPPVIYRYQFWWSNKTLLTFLYDSESKIIRDVGTRFAVGYITAGWAW